MVKALILTIRFSYINPGKYPAIIPSAAELRIITIGCKLLSSSRSMSTNITADEIKL